MDPAHTSERGDAEAVDHDHSIQKLTADEVGTLADRLFSRGISSLSTYSRREQADLIAASRALRALLQAYEHATGRPLRVVLLCGGL
jgi:hypothetical protein